MDHTDSLRAQNRGGAMSMQIGVAIAFNHLTTPDYIADAARFIDEAGFHSLWVPEHVLLFPDYASRYPYADDGRVPGNPQGVLDPFTALTFIAAQTRRVAPRHRHLSRAAAAAGVHGEDGRGPRLSVGWARRLRRRHRLARGRIPGARHGLSRARTAVRRVHRRDESVVGRRRFVLLRRNGQNSSRVTSIRSRCRNRTRRSISAAKASLR